MRKKTNKTLQNLHKLSRLQDCEFLYLSLISVLYTNMFFIHCWDMLSQTLCHKGLKFVFCLTQSSNCINSCQPTEDHFHLLISENVKKVESDFSIAAVKVGITVKENFVPTIQSDMFKPITMYLNQLGFGTFLNSVFLLSPSLKSFRLQ